MHGRRLRFAALFLAGIGLGVAAGLALQTLVLDRGFSRQGATRGSAAIGGAFSLVDQHGSVTSDADFRGRYMLVYFGYTFCPDVCPTELQDMALALDALGPEGDKVEPIFITVDPERDTVEVLADYAPLFHSRLRALTGTPEQIAAVSRAYGVYYAKAGGDEDAAQDEYLVDHSTLIYLMGPDGGYLTHFPFGTESDALAEGIRKFL